MWGGTLRHILNKQSRRDTGDSVALKAALNAYALACTLISPADAQRRDIVEEVHAQIYKYSGACITILKCATFECYIQ